MHMIRNLELGIDDLNLLFEALVDEDPTSRDPIPAPAGTARQAYLQILAHIYHARASVHSLPYLETLTNTLRSSSSSEMEVITTMTLCLTQPFLFPLHHICRG